MSDKIVAVALLNQREVEMLGVQFDRLWPVSETACFGAMLAAIDEADRTLWRERDAAATMARAAPI